MPSAFSWYRLILGVVAGSACALLLSWVVAPELASLIALQQRYEGPETATTNLMLYDILFSFAGYLAGSLVSYWIAKTKPYWACCAVGIVGWLVYYFEAGGIGGMLSREFPLWYEFAPTHLASSLLAAHLVTRRRSAA